MFSNAVRPIGFEGVYVFAAEQTIATSTFFQMKRSLRTRIFPWKILGLMLFLLFLFLGALLAPDTVVTNSDFNQDLTTPIEPPGGGPENPADDAFDIDDAETEAIDNSLQDEIICPFVSGGDPSDLICLGVHSCEKDDRCQFVRDNPRCIKIMENSYFNYLVFFYCRYPSAFAIFLLIGWMILLFLWARIIVDEFFSRIAILISSSTHFPPAVTSMTFLPLATSLDSTLAIYISLRSGKILLGISQAFGFSALLCTLGLGLVSVLSKEFQISKRKLPRDIFGVTILALIVFMFVDRMQLFRLAGLTILFSYVTFVLIVWVMDIAVDYFIARMKEQGGPAIPALSSAGSTLTTPLVTPHPDAHSPTNKDAPPHLPHPQLIPHAQHIPSRQTHPHQRSSQPSPEEETQESTSFSSNTIADKIQIVRVIESPRSSVSTSNSALKRVAMTLSGCAPTKSRKGTGDSVRDGRGKSDHSFVTRESAMSYAGSMSSFGRLSQLASSQISPVSGRRSQTTSRTSIHVLISDMINSFLGKKGIHHRGIELFCRPLWFLCYITIPIPTSEFWNPIIMVLSPISSILVCLFAFRILALTVHGIPVAPFFALLAVLVSAFIMGWIRKERGRVQLNKLFLFFGFWSALGWTYLITNELVNTIDALGLIFQFPRNFLGSTLLVWGFVFEDIATVIFLGKFEFAHISVSMCFIWTAFHLTVGIGAGLLIHADTVVVPDQKSAIVTLSFVTVIVAMVSHLVVVIASNFRITKLYGYWNICLYIIFFVLIALDTSGVLNF